MLSESLCLLFGEGRQDHQLSLPSKEGQCSDHLKVTTDDTERQPLMEFIADTQKTGTGARTVLGIEVVENQHRVWIQRIQKFAKCNQHRGTSTGSAQSTEAKLCCETRDHERLARDLACKVKIEDLSVRERWAVTEAEDSSRFANSLWSMKASPPTGLERLLDLQIEIALVDGNIALW
jgi:hypothetical protein